MDCPLILPSYYELLVRGGMLIENVDAMCGGRVYANRNCKSKFLDGITDISRRHNSHSKINIRMDMEKIRQVTFSIFYASFRFHLFVFLFFTLRPS